MFWNILTSLILTSTVYFAYTKKYIARAWIPVHVQDSFQEKPRGVCYFQVFFLTEKFRNQTEYFTPDRIEVGAQILFYWFTRIKP